MKKLNYIFLTLILGLFLTACSGNTDQENQTEEDNIEQEVENTEELELTVSAAASLTESLNEIQEIYKEKEDIHLNLNLDSSGALQKQIEEGAPVDVFISAAENQMDKLEDEGLLLEDTREDLLKNALVVIKSNDLDQEINKLEDLRNIEGKIAVAEMETVPVGQYTKETLENEGLLEDLESQFVIGKNVKATLQYVERGEAEVGFVFLSDGLQAKDSEIAIEIDSSLHAPINYPIAIIKDTENEETAKKFVEFLKSDEAREIFEKYGFKAGE